MNNSRKGNSMDRFLQTITTGDGIASTSSSFLVNPYQNQGSSIPKVTPLQQRPSPLSTGTASSKFSTLSLNSNTKKRSFESSFVTADKIEKSRAIQKESKKFSYLPVLHKPSTSTAAAPNNSTVKQHFKSTENQNRTKDDAKKQPVENTTRNLPIDIREKCVITGKIDFILKTHRSFPNVNALYEVYGKILKITNGKYDCQNIILLRNTTGPVLQGFYYEIDRKLSSFEIGENVRCVGRFNHEGKFQIFKIISINSQLNDDDLIRMQNICSLALKTVKAAAPSFKKT